MGFFDFLKPKSDIEFPTTDSQIPNSDVLINGRFENEFDIDDVFTITGRGVVVTGNVVSGNFSIGDEVTILSSNEKVVITGIEQFRKSLNFAQAGDNAGLLLSNLDRKEVSRGDILFK